MKKFAKLVFLLALNQGCLFVRAQSQPDSRPAPAFYYNTLGQPWQSIAPGQLDWENTVGYSNTLPKLSANSSSIPALTSLVTGLTSWADISAVIGAAFSGMDAAQTSGLFGCASHLAWDLGADNGLALYAAPAWTFDGSGIASSSVSLTAAAGHEPAQGWSQDVNLAINYTDQGAFNAEASPDLIDLWTGSWLVSAGHQASDHLSGYSLEGFGSYSDGEISPSSGAQTKVSAWRLGGGLGYQRNFGNNPAGLNAWACYGGLQWEWADVGLSRIQSTPSLVFNFSLGLIRTR